MKRYVVLWIDTDGEFYMRSFVYRWKAERLDQANSESGLPSVFLSREDLIYMAANGFILE